MEWFSGESVSAHSVAVAQGPNHGLGGCDAFTKNARNTPAERNYMKVTVVGIGYVGLANALLLSKAHQVTMLDIDQSKVDLVNKRKCPLDDPLMQEHLISAPRDFCATRNDTQALTDADLVLIATPTNYDDTQNGFDTGTVDAVITRSIELNNSSLVVIKSTVPVGYTNAQNTKHQTDRIVFSPEFLREGTAMYDVMNPSRIVVGDRTHRGEQLANALRTGSDAPQASIQLTGSAEAEAIKLFANTFLAMRVAFFNELDTFAATHKLDARQIISGVCNDPRIGDHYNNPSFGYGGYCLPKDTKQLLANYAGIPNDLMAAIVASNTTRQEFIAKSVMALNPKVVGIYRVVMKAGSDNTRSSSISGVISRLMDQGIKVIVYEPVLSQSDFCGAPILTDLQAFKMISDVIVANRWDDDLLDVTSKVFTRDLFGRG